MPVTTTKNLFLLRNSLCYSKSSLLVALRKSNPHHGTKTYQKTINASHKLKGIYRFDNLENEVASTLRNGRYHCLMGAVVTGISTDYQKVQSLCEAAAHFSELDTSANKVATSMQKANLPPKSLLQRWKTKVKKTLRLLKRAIQLLLVLTPLVGLYPLRKLLPHSNTSNERGDKKHSSALVEKYFQMCLGCIEWAGATIIKLTQWASSRPDLFGEDFCEVFSRLQDDTTPHELEHTIKILEDAYGKDWENQIQLGEIIGSGCIGQVYKGTAKERNGGKSAVAIKVMHPDVRTDIYTDLELLRIFVDTLENLPFDLGKRFKYYDLPGIVKKFEDLLVVQLDFRNEANHLDKFRKNFANDDGVIFPEVKSTFEPHQDILIESFCEGTPILQFAKIHENDKKVLSNLCNLGIKTVCKMIFEDNFIHGDLHPGNILVSPSHKLVLLDAGMITEYDDEEHNKLISILTCFIRKNGRRAGELLIADSNSRMKDFNEVAIKEEAYIKKIEALTNEANGRDYLMKKLGTYISYICDAAAMHHVMMNPTFVSAALAVKIQEGVVLALDPNASIWSIANPMILRTELYHELKKLKNSLARKIESFQ